MRVTLAIIGIALLFAASASAGPDVIIRERAKELRDQNNVRQGVPPPIQPSQTPPMPNVPAPPTPSPALVRFQTELAGIKADSQLSGEQKQRLAQDLLIAAQGAKPSLSAANKLAADLFAAFVEKPLSATSRARLIQELDAVLNPGKYPQAKMEGIFTDIQAIFQENGLARAKAAAIAEDVKTLAREIQGGGAK